MGGRGLDIGIGIGIGIGGERKLPTWSLILIWTEHQASTSTSTAAFLPTQHQPDENNTFFIY